jgi:hypothetical protein
MGSEQNEAHARQDTDLQGISGELDGQHSDFINFGYQIDF